MCGCAWSLPPGDEIESLIAVAEFAPGGLGLPAYPEIAAAGLKDWVTGEVPYSEAEADLQEFLGFPALTYESMVAILLERIPDFRTAVDTSDGVVDLPYVVFGRFATFLNDRIPRCELSDLTIQASFRLLNQMCEVSDARVMNLAAVGVFEVLTDSPQSIRTARELLYGRAIDQFETMITLWGVDVREP